jgi:hypothetical protein
VCWAPLTRDFTQVPERQGEVGRLGKLLVTDTEDLFAYWHQHKEDELSFAAFQETMGLLSRAR